MAYVSKEKMEQVRRDLKAEFPNIKFKVNKCTGHSTIYVTIVSAPYRFIDAETPYKDVSPWQQQ
ncbi:MAG: hypothetical protein IPI29_08420 [Ignavibacteria bacterium]|nr:hypothetical protein [Ignavibacteria bacterium]